MKKTKKLTNFSTVRNSFLLDTHTFIWAMENSKRLPNDIKSEIASPKNKIFVSVATIWEIVIKRNLKKIKLSFDLEASITKASLDVLPIEISHVLKVQRLPNHHKDPFDRVLVAQSQVENLTLISHDQKIWKYDIDVLKV